MSYKTTIYISGITNLSDARFSAGMMVDYLGFCIEDKHPNSISKEEFIAIQNWITGIELIAEFYEKSVSEINELHTEFNFKHVLLPVSRKTDIDLINCNIILNLDDTANEDVSSLSDQQLVRCDNDSQDNLPKNSLANSFVNVTNESLENVSLDNVHGVCIQGGFEERPGFKDYDEIADILEKLEID